MLAASTISDRALAVARDRGIARARDFRAAGVPPSALSRLCAQGELVRLARGLYQLAEPEAFDAAHSLAEAARLAPHGVISLLSALAHHELTTQLPHAVWMTIAHKARAPRSLPFRVELDRRGLHGRADQRADRRRRRGDHGSGQDDRRLLQAPQSSRARRGDGLRTRKAGVDDLWRYAGIGRVRNVMRPYLEALS